MNHPPTVVLTGAEASGKTTLAAALAAQLEVPWLPEYAREYLAGRGPGYSREDVEAIARGQRDAEVALRQRHQGLAVLDTDLVVVQLWLTVRFGGAPAWIEAAIRPQARRYYVLTVPEMPWQPDPLREDEHRREWLHDRYRALLLRRGLQFIEVTGDATTRLVHVTDWLRAQGELAS